jgi:hypothetical protein
MAFPTLDALLWQPIASGLWRQHEARDGTYDCQDLADALEYLDVKDENSRRHSDYVEATRKEA